MGTSRQIALLAAGLFLVAPVWADSAPGRVVGHVDGIRFEKDGFYIWGWAGQQGIRDSVAIHFYADHSAYDATPGTFVFAAKADLDSEPDVNKNCRDREGGKHRFKVTLPNEVLKDYQGRRLYVHGIRVVGGGENSAIDGSGKWFFPKPPVFRRFPDVFPPLSGSYTFSSEHPRVFTTQAELSDLAKRINTPGTFSAQNFHRLADQIKKDLAARVDWDAAYAGHEEDVYLHAFSVEARPFYPNDLGSEDHLRAAMNIRPGLRPPKGAAEVASRLALYAALAKAGAIAPAGSPGPDQAAALVKRILLAWADHGFRDEQGNFLSASALNLARGVVYSVHAQDLLEGLGAFSPDEEARLNRFHGMMYDVIRVLSNERVKDHATAKYPDEVYNNVAACHLAGLLATARLLDDQEKFYTALYGGKGAVAEHLPWITLFDHVIYGPSDTPLFYITPNSSDDPLKSRPAYSTDIVAAGEISDRYRNDNPLQGIGYPMGTLEWLLDTAEILRLAGFDPYSYRGSHHQSLEIAIQYYAGLAQKVGFYKVVTAENSDSYPDAKQYYGKIVNAVEPHVIFGSYQFPKNDLITGVEAAAKVKISSKPFSRESLLFGRWRD